MNINDLSMCQPHPVTLLAEHPIKLDMKLIRQIQRFWTVVHIYIKGCTYLESSHGTKRELGREDHYHLYPYQRSDTSHCYPTPLSVSSQLDCTHVDYIPWLPVIAVHLVSFVSVLYHSSFLMVKLFDK